MLLSYKSSIYLLQSFKICLQAARKVSLELFLYVPFMCAGNRDTISTFRNKCFEKRSGNMFTLDAWWRVTWAMGKADVFITVSEREKRKTRGKKTNERNLFITTLESLCPFLLSSSQTRCFSHELQNGYAFKTHTCVMHYDTYRSCIMRLEIT